MLTEYMGCAFRHVSVVWHPLTMSSLGVEELLVSIFSKEGNNSFTP
jgi:hypothetical protein